MLENVPLCRLGDPCRPFSGPWPKISSRYIQQFGKFGFGLDCGGVLSAGMLCGEVGICCGRHTLSFEVYTNVLCVPSIVTGCVLPNCSPSGGRPCCAAIFGFISGIGANLSRYGVGRIKCLCKALLPASFPAEGPMPLPHFQQYSHMTGVMAMWFLARPCCISSAIGAGGGKKGAWFPCWPWRSWGCGFSGRILQRCCRADGIAWTLPKGNARRDFLLSKNNS